PGYTGDKNRTFGKGVKDRFIDFKPCPAFSPDLYFFRLYIGNVEVFLPGIGGLDFFDDVFQLPSWFMKIKWCLVFLRHIKGQTYIKTFTYIHFLFVNGQRKKGIILNFNIFRFLTPSAEEIVKRISCPSTLALSGINNRYGFS